jgi:hypothetical protein
MTDTAMSRLRTGESAEPRHRSMMSYLLMPRPKDLVKGLLIVVTYLLGLLSVGEVSGASVVRALVVVAAVELLIYPARYQWNDIRGFAADQQHPSSTGRGRLPGPLSRAGAHVSASALVAVARVATAGSLIALLPGLDLGPIVVFATAGVFGVAIVYEVLRSATTGRTGKIPAPISAGIILLWLTAGAGYAARGLIGLALAVDLPARPTLAAAAAITLWTYGIAFVTSRWALEAAAFTSLADGRVVWRARAGQAREHLLALVRWLPARTDGVRDVKDWAPLRDSTAQTAPWHMAMIAAGGAGALTGRLLCGPCSVADGAIMTSVGAAAAGAVAAGARWRVILIMLGAVVVATAATLMSSPRPIVSAVPWLLLMGAYLFFSTRTLRRLGRPNVLGVVIAAIGSAVGHAVVGGATWDALIGQRRPDENDPRT